MSSVDNLKGRIKIGSRKKAMRRDKFKRSMSESNLKTIMEESASEDESGYTSRSNSLTPPSSPPLRFGSSDQFSKFAFGAGAGMCLNKSRGLGISQTDRGDHWTDKGQRHDRCAVGEKPKISPTGEKSESESEVEKPRQVSAESRLQFIQETIELAIVKCGRIDQSLENLERTSSDYADSVLYQDYQLFPKTPRLSLSFTSVLNYPPVSMSSI